jgi:hypothetical protein
MSSADVGARIGLAAPTLVTSIYRERWHRIPRPAGKLGGMYYWLRDEVENWASAHPEIVAENQRRIAKGSKTSR